VFISNAEFVQIGLLVS